MHFEAALKSENRKSKHEMVRPAHHPEPSRRANSNDRNLNDINGKRQYHPAFILNFKHWDFDIVSADLIKMGGFRLL
jgi:hypothetical protein